MQTENTTCKCCGTEVPPIWEVTPKYIYNDFDATGQEIDPIFCGEEWDIIGFPDYCTMCTIEKTVVEPDKDDEDTEDDLPF